MDARCSRPGILTSLAAALAAVLLARGAAAAGSLTDSVATAVAPYAPLAAGRDFTCAVLMDGRVQCFGLGVNGQLGRLDNSNVGYSQSATVVGGGTVPGLPAGVRADAVIAGGCFAGAIIKSASQPIGPSEPGDLLMWGCCSSGQCGTGSTTSIGDSAQAPVFPAGLVLGLPGGRKVLTAVAGDRHVCVLLAAAVAPSGLLRQDVTCFGANEDGQLGRGDSAMIGHNASLSGLASLVDLGRGGTRNVVGLCAGLAHSCALDDEGSVTCWGRNSAGQLGLGHTNPVGAGGGTAMPADVGAIDFGNQLGATQIACGFTHTCALLNDSSVRCWGNSTLGQTGLGRTDLVASVPSSLPSLTGPVYLYPGTRALAIFAGGDSTAAIVNVTTNSRLMTWGANNRGQLGLSSTNNIGDNELPGNGAGSFPMFGNIDGRAPYLAAVGAQHMCIATIWDHVMCVGAGNVGQLGYNAAQDIGDNERASGAGLVAFSTWGILNYSAVGPYPDQIVIGGTQACAILDDRVRVACWGINSEGYLGLGFTNSSGLPITPPGAYTGTAAPAYVDVGNGLRVMRLAMGDAVTCAIREDNAVICWGINVEGALGCGRGWNEKVGDDEPAYTCVVPNLGASRMPVQVACTGWSCAAVMNDMTTFMWGNNDRYALGMHNIGSRQLPVQYNFLGSGQVIAVSGADRHFFFMREDGGVSAGTGQNDNNYFAICGGCGNMECCGGGWNSNTGLFPRFVFAGGRQMYAIRADSQLASGGEGGWPTGGIGGWGDNGMRYIDQGMRNLDNWILNVGGTGQVASMARSLHGSCYVTTDLATRCFGHPYIAAYGTNQVIGDNEQPKDAGPISFPAAFGTVVPMASNTYSSMPYLQLCMIGTSGQPACWGDSSRYQLGLLRGTTEPCGDNEVVATCGVVPMGNGASVGVYPPTVVTARALPYPAASGGSALGTVLALEVKHVGKSRNEPRQLIAFLGTSSVGCDSLKRVSPNLVLCALSPPTLLQLKQSIQTASKTFVITLQWWTPTVIPQAALNLGRPIVWDVTSVNSVTPSVVDTVTQQRITLDGANFGASPNSNPRVFIGRSECLSVIWQSPTSLSCLTPNFAGTYEVVVTVDGSLYPSRGGAFLSTITPSVIAAAPAIISQGDTITITGRGFGSSAAVASAANINVTIDGQLCTPVVFDSDTQIRCGPAPLITKRNALVIVGLGGQASSPGVTVSASYPIITALAPSFVWTGDSGAKHDFIVTGANLDASVTISIGGVACPGPISVLSASSVLCRGLPVDALNAASGVVAVTAVGTPSNVAPLLSVLPRANVTAITPSSARPGSTVLIEGVWLGRTSADILNVSLGSTNCTSWRYAAGGSGSIVCVVGPGRGSGQSINVFFVDGPTAAVSYGLTFSYVRDVSLTFAWSAGSSSSIALPSSPGSYALPLIPAPQLRVFDDAGNALQQSVAATLVCTIGVDGSSPSSAVGLSSTRLFQGTQASVDAVTGAIFDNLAVEGAMGASLPLRANCGVPPSGPFFASPLLSLSVARVTAIFSTVPANGSMPTTLGAIGTSITALSPTPQVQFSVNGASLTISAAAAALIPCQVEAWPAGAGAASAAVRAVGSISQVIAAASTSVAFPNVGVAAALGASFQLAARCSWLQNEIVSVLSPPISLSAVVPSWAAAPPLPSQLQFNTFFSLPALQLLGSNGAPLAGLARAEDVSCSISITSNAAGVAFIGGVPGAYNPASGSLAFGPLAVQPQLPDSEATPVPMLLSIQCTVRGQTVPPSVMSSVFVTLSLQRLRITWAVAPPMTAMPSSCGRSWNSTALGGTLDATSGLLTGGSQGKLASAATLLSTMQVSLLDYDSGLPAVAETGGVCTIAAINATFSYRTPAEQRHAALGGPTTVFTQAGSAIFDSVSLSAPLGSTVVIVATCARASGGRAFSVSSSLALNDAEANWQTVPTSTAAVLSGGRSVPVPALAVVYNATTTVRVTLRIREPYFAMWGPSAPYSVRDYVVGTDPAASCSLVLVNNAIVSTSAGGTVAVPLDLDSAKLYLLPGSLPASATLIVASQPGAAWTVGAGGAVSLSFRLAAPLDVPVAVQAYCAMGSSTLLSAPLVLAASAAQLAFALGGKPSYGIIPTFDEDPQVNFLNPVVSFGLLGLGSNAGFLANCGDGLATSCTLQVVQGSVSASAASASQLLSCTSDVTTLSSDNDGNVVTGALVTAADCSTGLASFPTAFLRGPLGSAFTLRASCSRPAIGGPVSFLDTSLMLADIDVRWNTVFGSGLAPTALQTDTTPLQAGVPLYLTVALSWLVPVKRVSSFGAAPAPLRVALNSSTATPALIASCSLRVPDSNSLQVSTASMHSQVHNVPADASGIVTFQTTFLGPTDVTIRVYADCTFPRSLVRSTPPLLVQLSPQPPPAVRRAAVSHGASPSTWVKPTATGSSSFWRIGSLTSSNSPTPSSTPSSTHSDTSAASNTRSLTMTPSISNSTAFLPSMPSAAISLVSSKSISATLSPSGSASLAVVSAPASSLPRSSSPSPSLPAAAAVVRFDLGVTVPDSQLSALFSSMQDPSVVAAISADVLGLVTRASAASPASSMMEAPLAMSVAALTNVQTGQRVVLSSAAPAQPLRRLSSASANIKVTLAASFASPAAAAATSSLLPSLAVSSSGMTTSLQALATASGLPAANLTFLAVDPASVVVISPSPAPSSAAAVGIQPASPASSSEGGSAAVGSAIGAAVGVAVLVAIASVAGIVAYRMVNKQAAVAAYRDARKRRLLEHASDNGSRGYGNEEHSIDLAGEADVSAPLRSSRHASGASTPRRSRRPSLNNLADAAEATASSANKEQARASAEALERAARLLGEMEASMARQQNQMMQQQAAFAAQLHNTLANLTVTATSTASASATAAASFRPLTVSQMQTVAAVQPISDADTYLGWLTKHADAYSWLRQIGAVRRSGEKTAQCPILLEDTEIPFRDADVLMGLAAHGFVIEKARTSARTEPLFTLRDSSSDVLDHESADYESSSAYKAAAAAAAAHKSELDAMLQQARSASAALQEAAAASEEQLSKARAHAAVAAADMAEAQRLKQAAAAEMAAAGAAAARSAAAAAEARAEAAIAAAGASEAAAAASAASATAIAAASAAPAAPDAPSEASTIAADTDANAPSGARATNKVAQEPEAAVASVDKNTDGAGSSQPKRETAQSVAIPPAYPGTVERVRVASATPTRARSAARVRTAVPGARPDRPSEQFPRSVQLDVAAATAASRANVAAAEERAAATAAAVAARAAAAAAAAEERAAAAAAAAELATASAEERARAEREALEIALKREADAVARRQEREEAEAEEKRARLAEVAAERERLQRAAQVIAVMKGKLRYEKKIFQS